MKKVGSWWNDSSIDLVKLADGHTYALSGWNGEDFGDCWRCTGKYYRNSSAERYTLRPIYSDVMNENDGYDIINYDVVLNG